MKSVAIVEGWAGGPKLTTKLRELLKGNGLRMSKDVGKADYVIAQSAGCYALPKSLRAKAIILINPPYWPGQTIVGRLLRHTKSDTRFLLDNYGLGSLLTNRAWEFFYFLAKPSLTWRALANQAHLTFLGQLAGKRLIVVRNHGDTFCSPQIADVLKKYPNAGFVQLPGGHSDYYYNPQPYVDLLLKEL